MNSVWTRHQMLENKKLLVGAYLCGAILYNFYPEEQPVLTDEDFDWVCVQLARYWEEIDHKHKHIINYEDVLSGSSMSLRIHDFPNGLKHTALKLSKGWRP